jgi:hypothetical protein
MARHTRIESECLGLIGRLFSSLGDDAAFSECRSECEAWQFRNRRTYETLAAFLCQQLRRAAEARQVSREISGGRSDVCAVVMLGEGGRVLAASAGAWAILHVKPGQTPLPLPSALAAYLSPMLSSGVPFPRALRVALDDRSGDVAGVVLGVDQIPGQRPTHVATLLLWNPSLDAFSTAGTLPRSAYFRLAASD